MPARGVLLALVLFAPEPGARAADPDALQDCRELRHAEPALALQRCEAAAQSPAAGTNPDQAFEALMHAAQLASQLGDGDRARGALESATALLPGVQDPLAGHRLARRRGLLAYREGRSSEALSRFLEALAAARTAKDATATAVSDNDLGVVYRHLGDYQASLQHYQASLETKQRLGESEIGSSLANVGSLFLELGDTGRARDYLERALQAHRAADRRLLETQTLEELARVAEREGDAEGARNGLLAAWERHGDAEAARDRLRVALRLAELEAGAGAAEAARRWLDEVERLSTALQRPAPLRAAVIEAGLAQDAPSRERAYRHLRQVLSAEPGDEPALRAEAERQLADLAEALGRSDQALAHLRSHQRLAAQQAESRHAQRLDALRVRFEVAQLESERDRLAAQGATQRAELEQGRARTLMLALAALLALGAVMLWSQRRLYRHRLQAQCAQAELEQRIAQARRAADLLRSDLRSLAWLLDQQSASVLVFDAGGAVRLVTTAAATRLGSTVEQLQGRALADVLGTEPAQWAQSVVESASLSEVAGGDSSCASGAGLRLRCRRLALEEELGVLWLGEAGSESEPAAVMPEPAREREDSGSERPAQFREQLVTLMQASLEAWERATRKTRIDLAEASGVWRITVDDGRLRVRAMDRYLSLEALPERPRWREVVRTAYFVLTETRIEPRQRERIEALVEAVLAATRRG